MNRPRVVYDCMLYVQALLRPEPVRSTIQLIYDTKITLFTSDEIVNEIRDVTTRPRFIARFTAKQKEDAARLIEDIIGRSERLSKIPSAFKLIRDPKDEPYINLAIAVRPSFLVTWNDRHLTYLRHRDTPEGVDF